MNNSKSIYFGAIFIGSILGGYLPTLFGASWLSLWSLVGSTIVALVFLIIAYQLLKNY